MSMIDLGRFTQDGVGVKGNMVKSIQYVTIDSTDGTSATLSSAVDPDYSILFQISGSGRSIPYPVLTDSTTIAWSSLSDIEGPGVTFVVIEFESWAVKSIHSGLQLCTTRSSTYPGGSNNVTLSPAVNPDRCLYSASFVDIDSSDADYLGCNPVITSSTNLDLRIYYNGLTADRTVGYTVIELI